jgi:hypothetical protein
MADSREGIGAIGVLFGPSPAPSGSFFRGDRR